MNCNTCANQDGCKMTWITNGKACGCWEGIQADPAIELERLDVKVQDIAQKHEATLKQAEERAAKREELEVWRQAYNAALSCSNVCNTEACDCANSALIDYRAKREEMGR